MIDRAQTASATRGSALKPAAAKTSVCRQPDERARFPTGVVEILFADARNNDDFSH
jgi:hypothetical protein